jgi:hypothetical protein
METVGDLGHVKFLLVRLEMVLVLVHDSCKVCTKHTIGSEIVLEATNGAPG